MLSDNISDEDLLHLVSTTDRQFFDAGMDIQQRSWKVPQAVMKQFGYIGYAMSGAGKPTILNRIEAAFVSIYRKQDVAIGGHIGVFMFRDVFARISVPLIYGTVRINPFRHVELTEVQLRIMNSEPGSISSYLDQFFDVADIQYGIPELRQPYRDSELVTRFIDLGRLHLHAAAAILTGGYDFRGAVQSSLLATELALKAGAAAQGLTEDGIKERFGHHNAKTASFVGAAWPAFDAPRIQRVLAAQPAYVPNRYSASQPSRREVGHLVMGAQYVVAEVTRQMSDRDFRGIAEPPEPRTYPA